MAQGKNDHTDESRLQLIQELDKFIEESKKKWGTPPPLTPEEEDELETEIHNYHRTKILPTEPPIK